MTEPPPIGSEAAMEMSLGLPNGLLSRLRDEGDDWTFVIRTHALVEAAITHLLVAAVRRSDTESVFARLELSNTATGKIAFVAALKLLPKPHCAFIRAFSELRNLLVHDVRNVTFTFASYLSQMNRDQLAKFEKAFGGIFARSSSAHADALRKRFAERPRDMVWASAMIIVAACYVAKERAALEPEQERLAHLIDDEEADMNAQARAFMRTVLQAVQRRGKFTIRLGQRGHANTDDAASRGAVE